MNNNLYNPPKNGELLSRTMQFSKMLTKRIEFAGKMEKFADEIIKEKRHPIRTAVGTELLALVKQEQESIIKEIEDMGAR